MDFREIAAVAALLDLAADTASSPARKDIFKRIEPALANPQYRPEAAPACAMPASWAK